MNTLLNIEVIQEQYAQRVTALAHAGITTLLPESKCTGVIGIDRREYPLPTKEQVVELFTHNQELVERKSRQGFTNLQVTPVAMPTLQLADLLQKAIIKYAGEGKIYRSGGSASYPLVPVRVNKEKQVWIWETLRGAIDTHTLIYFPQQYLKDHHQGQTKLEVIHNERICAIPGWSVGLVEAVPIMPAQGQGKTIGGRKQLEIGYSPYEYLQTLKQEAYEGETGKLLEDFITAFLTQLISVNEVNNDVDDNNALWCMGQYLKVPYAELVPTGRWYQSVGRVRLDMHRTKNKQCTKSWGCATIVRLRSCQM